jgi:hypothetical protein
MANPSSLLQLHGTVAARLSPTQLKKKKCVVFTLFHLPFLSPLRARARCSHVSCEAYTRSSEQATIGEPGYFETVLRTGSTQRYYPLAAMPCLHPMGGMLTRRHTAGDQDRLR